MAEAFVNRVTNEIKSRVPEVTNKSVLVVLNGVET